MPRPTRFVGVLAAGALAAVALSPAAHADSGNVIESNTALSSAAAVSTQTAGTTTEGITPNVVTTAVATDGLTYGFNASSSTDSNAGATITGYSFDFGDGNTVSGNTTGSVTHGYTTPGSYTVTVTVTDSLGNSATVTASVTTRATDYTPDGPVRLLDTRSGLGAAKGAVTNGHTIAVQIAGVDGVPADATAVVLNITVTDTVTGGYLYGFADGVTPTSASNINFGNAESMANLVTLPLGADGKVDLGISGASTTTAQIVGDLQGYYSPTAADGYTPIQPGRIVDTRSGLGTAEKQLGPTSTLAVTVTGATATTETNKTAGNTTEVLPSSGITAVALNVTLANVKGNGVVTVHPDGTATPATSNINYSGVNIANAVIVAVPADGKIDITNGNIDNDSLDVIVDVEGYYVAGNSSTAAAYVPITPTRIYDTRDYVDDSVPAGGYLHVPVNTGGTVPSYALNITVASPATIGDLAVYPDATQDNITSNLNFGTNETIANFDQATTSSSGIDIANESTGTSAVVVDEFGYFTTQ